MSNWLLRLGAAMLGCLCAGCAPFRDLPRPDPIWAATVSAYEPDMLGPKSPRHVLASEAQKAATKQARAYVARSLPASIDDFTKDLQRQGFLCNVYGGGAGFECIYSQARPPYPCFGSLRVSIEVDFPYRTDDMTITEKDIDLAAMVVPVHDLADLRGCAVL